MYKASQGYVVDLVVEYASTIGKHGQIILVHALQLELRDGSPPTAVKSADLAPGILTPTILIVDEGTEVITFGQLMYKCTTLENSRLCCA